jgi:hypothetical protein
MAGRSISDAASVMLEQLRPEFESMLLREFAHNGEVSDDRLELFVARIRRAAWSELFAIRVENLRRRVEMSEPTSFATDAD